MRRRQQLPASMGFLSPSHGNPAGWAATTTVITVGESGLEAQPLTRRSRLSPWRWQPESPRDASVATPGPDLQPQVASEGVPAARSDVATAGPWCIGRAGQAGQAKNTHFGADRLGPSSPLPRRCGEPAGISLKWRRALERSGSSGTGSLFLDKRQGEGLGASSSGGRSCRARAGACMWGHWGPPPPRLRPGPAPQQVSAAHCPTWPQATCHLWGLLGVRSAFAPYGLGEHPAPHPQTQGTGPGTVSSGRVPLQPWCEPGQPLML